ncbi:phenylpyruvate tautomerase PptA (4-oxalocrotonate tautomerase family) [Rhizobium sp. ERR 1071]|uniref:tautomerase family protein n=1 Tax=Rhizobium sp. ERR 1071 TaxID=2572677 RepID=UPI00119A77BF|nr:tautomerase family protein [Rhizobium sp. ERR1071]TWB09551.1 phenylpyruvate tautomerase PptA (4-oxalocrotonate tautomerase family) [Rhizobium sp. ERR1071]
MPLTHIALRSGKSESYRKAICDSFHRAMTETFDVSEDNDFIIITEHDAANFRYDANYLGIDRSSDLVFIQITANNTRTIEQKKALFSRVATALAEDPGLRSEDIFISLVEVEKENWSLGNGLAQYA